MHLSIQHRILNATNAQSILSTEQIQPLWNHYGVLSRLTLHGSSYKSVILKHIQIPMNHKHPKGFGTRLSRQRKIKSYHVEQYWYQHYNTIISSNPLCRTPICIDAFDSGDEIFILLEDLTTAGFTPLSYSIDWKYIEVVLRWLAYFHAQFLHHTPVGLWTYGTYWHLATRPDELKQIQGTTLHWIASCINAQLNSASFQTFVHGDAKLANFCFHEQENKVAAVDFQYIGQGCGMKDLAYFVGSVFNEEECEVYEQRVLTCYFSYLNIALQGKNIDLQALETEWRALYHVCWADFQRFLLGWSPKHKKHTVYTQKITDGIVQQIIDELLHAATQACKEAGLYIMSQWKGTFEVNSKEYDSLANAIVTEVDLESQRIIQKILFSTMQKYNIGSLAEESIDDKSRFEKHVFWAIDPLDGTRYFAQGQSGFAVSIALVNQKGESLMGVVYDPVKDCLYHAVKGYGVYKNGIAWTLPIKKQNKQSQSLTRYADISLSHHSQIKKMLSKYDIQYCGGAVMNIIHVITQSSAFYTKKIRLSVGGCAIWDIAAVTLMLSEMGGSTSFLDGSPILLNRPKSCYFHDVGLLFHSANLSKDDLNTLLT